MKTFIFGIAMALSLSARAASPAIELDGKEAHGGNVVVCKAADGKIDSVQLIDFYEGEILYGLKIPTSSVPFEQQALDVAKVLDAATDVLDHNTVHQKEFQAIIDHLRILPTGVRLKPVDDSKDILIPNGCSTEQLALYTQDGLVHIVRDYWERLSNTDKAGLVGHEALFKFERQAGQTDSIRARKINALAFSGSTFTNVLPRRGVESYLCEAMPDARNQLTFFAHVEPNGDSVTIDYTYLPGSGLVYSLKESQSPYPIQLFPFANGRANPSLRLGSAARACMMTSVRTDFEDFDFIHFCITRAVTPDSASIGYSMEIAPKDEPMSTTSVDYYCRPY